MIVTLTRMSQGGVLDKQPKSKTCCDCGEEKPLRLFRKNEKMKDGRLSRCNKCARKREVKQNEKKLEYAKQFFVHDKYYS